jgi:hypothetical protein
VNVRALLVIGVPCALAPVELLACKGRSAATTAAADAASRDAANVDDAGAGCRDNAACGPDRYCAFEPLLCGKGKRPGTCRTRPGSCTGTAFSPVCGCDGEVYGSECAAHAAGVDLAVMGGCGTRTPNWMPCGKQFCDVRKDYCAIYLSDVFELPTDYFCRPLPAGCLPGDGSVVRACDCFPPDVACRSFCGVVRTDGLPGFHLTCQGLRPPRER